MEKKYYEVPMAFKGVVIIKAYNQEDAKCCIEEMADDEIFNNCYGDWEVDGEIGEYDSAYGAIDAYDWIDPEVEEDDEEEEEDE